ncbi:hypothetical protein V6N11_081084 [Hibiscus sabdariffa]|uniref:Uncharacterized protein n=1 Tax=Hibiscus sabdariffa TaxID=183260 RepID=A0ABR2QIV6_9ROSI
MGNKRVVTKRAKRWNPSIRIKANGGVGKTGYPVNLPRIGPGPGSHQFLKTGIGLGPDQTGSQIPGIGPGIGGNRYQYPIN